MNKKIFSSAIVLLFVFFISNGFKNISNCDETSLKAEMKPLLKPTYKYDSSQTTKFTLKSTKQSKGIAVPLFKGERYKFLFNIAGLPEGIDINIYDKKEDGPKRKPVFSLNQVRAEGQTVYSFEPSKAKKLFIIYSIPESMKEDVTGCVVFLLGYKMSNF